MVYNKLFAVPVGKLVILFFVDAVFKAVSTAAGEAALLTDLYKAATPATCGVAIEVPLMVFTADVLVNHADVMLVPGAKISTIDP